MRLSNQLELRHIRYFLSVAEELHFRNAAEKLYISQPGLSRQIRQLEETLGIHLFERHNRKVVLTTTGQYLKGEFESIFKDIEAAVHHAQLLEKGIEGHLRLGFIGSAMQNVIPDFLTNVRNEYPNVQYDLKEMDNKQQIDRLLSQDIDIGFVRLDKVPVGLHMKPVFEDTFSLVLPKGHRINKDNFKSLTQLINEPFVLFDASYSGSYYQKVMKIFEDSGFNPKIAHNTVHATTIYRLVERKFGLSIVPSALQKGYKMDIKFIPLTNIKHRTTLQMVWNKKNNNPVLNTTIGLV
ncbi:LysR family transcriptional regulator [Spongiivirga sp. MCCC 1A20706]|uniref:LysR family transcriptional regulator n=1 Tax=Spongiivirga sp. MCCC 1A20706 TaxID=3160963 RepID=UPI00397739D4